MSDAVGLVVALSEAERDHARARVGAIEDRQAEAILAVCRMFGAQPTRNPLEDLRVFLASRRMAEVHVVSEPWAGVETRSLPDDGLLLRVVDRGEGVYDLAGYASVGLARKRGERLGKGETARRRLGAEHFRSVGMLLFDERARAIAAHRSRRAPPDPWCSGAAASVRVPHTLGGGRPVCRFCFRAAEQWRDYSPEPVVSCGREECASRWRDLLDSLKGEGVGSGLNP